MFLFVPWIVTLLSSVPCFIAAQGREITCSCTTTHCREFGQKVCNTTGLCFSQYLDRRDGTDPLVRGCVESKTPLLCENRRPAVPRHRGWPVLICCDKNMCNAGATPTLPTSTEEVTTESATPADSLDIAKSTRSPSSLRDRVYIALVLVGIFAVISIVLLAIFLTRRQAAALFDPEFGRVGPNGYVKGCSEPPPPLPIAHKGLDNRFALDT